MNLQALLDDLNVPHREGGTHPHVRPGWLGIDCPWCGPASGKWHLGVNLEGAYAVCWRCGPKRLPDVLMMLTGKSYPEIRKLLDTVEKGPRTPRAGPEPSGRVKIPPGVEALGGAHRRYLRGRGFDPAVTESLWGVKGIGLAPRLAWRLWIPIVHRGETVSWITRSIGDRSGRRYVSARPAEESVPHKFLLYGSDYARHSVVVCEGPLDAWAIGPGAVALMGLIHTAEQLEALERYPVRTICFDREPAAQRRAGRLAQALAASPGETNVIELESGGDAAEADPAEIGIIRERYLN